MVTANGIPGIRWETQLRGGDLARALAAGGVLFAIDARRRSASTLRPELMVASATELLRELLSDLIRVESPLLPWAAPIDNEGEAPSWMPSPQVLDEMWFDFMRDRRDWFHHRDAVDGLGRPRNAPPKTGVRLQVATALDLIEGASKTLISQFTEIDSLSVGLTRSTPNPEWNWPAKLRVLAAPNIDPNAVQVFRRTSLEKRPWMADHLIVLPESSEDRADFALLFADTADAGEALLSFGDAVVNADCLIVATPSGVQDAIPMPTKTIQKALRRLNATGIVFQPDMRVDQPPVVSWMIEFVRELSHTVTIDVAAMRAAERTKLSAPTLYLSKAFLEHGHVRRRQELILARLEEAVASDEVQGIPGLTSQALGVDARVTAPELARALRARLTPLDFGSESSGASVIAVLSELVDQLPLRPIGIDSLKRQAPAAYGVEQAPAAYGVEQATVFEVQEVTTDASSRFLQAQLLRVKNRRLVDKFKSLAHLGNCFVRVRIGYRSGTWTNFGNTPFPTDLLPRPSVDGWTLQVYVFTNSAEPPQNTSMFLPAAGASEPVEFQFKTGDGSTRFKARIVVAHENRVLQSAWLDAPVEDENGKAKGRVARGLEAVVKQNLTALDDRSVFGAFLVVNDSLTNGPGVAIASGPSAVLRTPPDLAKTIEFIDSELTKVSENPEKYEGGLKSPRVVQMLRSLAQYGSMMYEAIVSDHDVDKSLIAAERIQVVAAEPWARLPIEFFYDRPAPEPNAPLCPGAFKCLGGAMASAPTPCNDACPEAGATKDVICPRGFWGLRKVIEWHRHSGSKDGDSNFHLLSEPVAGRKSIKAFQSVLFAHSDLVNAHYDQASSDVLAALKAASTQANTANNWNAWRTGVENTSPLLMVVLPHNEESPNKLSELSIGTGRSASHRLLVSSIDDKIVKGPSTIPGAIVMLLGCETGAPKTSYLGYVPKFRRHGASIIVSTGSVVLGRQISPICVQLIKGLQAAIASGPTPLGEVMLRLRREALADGYPIVLALSASGDADWLIE